MPTDAQRRPSVGAKAPTNTSSHFTAPSSSAEAILAVMKVRGFVRLGDPARQRLQSTPRWPWNPERGSVPIAWRVCSAPAAWARCTAPATRDSTAPSPSRSCPASVASRPGIPAAVRTRSAALSRRCRTRTSARSTTSASQDGARSSWSWSISKARRWPTRCEPAAAARSGAPRRHRRSPMRSTGASHRHRPPRPQARQHHADERGAPSCSTSALRRSCEPVADQRR